MAADGQEDPRDASSSRGADATAEGFESEGRLITVIRRRKSERQNFLPEITAHPMPAVSPQRDEESRKGWRGDISAQIRGEFRTLGARVFLGDPMVDCRGERR